MQKNLPEFILDPQDTTWISEYHGMELDPIAAPDRRGNENGGLFYSTYLCLLVRYAETLSADEENPLNRVVNEDFISNHAIRASKITDNKMCIYNNKIVPGIYDRGALESNTLDRDSIREISHDEITANAVIGMVGNTGHHINIYLYGIENKFRFDNRYPLSPRKERTFHPRDMAFYSLIGKQRRDAYIISPWFVLKMIFLLATQYITAKEKYSYSGTLLDKFLKRYKKEVDTSGPQLLFNRITALFALIQKMARNSNRDFKAGSLWSRYNNTILRLLFLTMHKIENKVLETHGSWSSVFDIYYRNPNHPTRVLVKEYEKLLAEHKANKEYGVVNG